MLLRRVARSSSGWSGRQQTPAPPRKVTPLTGVLLNALFKFEDSEEFRSLAGRIEADQSHLVG